MFETERCFIRSYQKSDCADVKKLYLDEEVRKFLGGIRHEDSIELILEEMLQPSDTSYHWVVREKRTEDFIGLLSLDPHHDGFDLEVSYQLLPITGLVGCWLCHRSGPSDIDFALSELPLPKVIAETQTANVSSCKLLEKLGMKLEEKIHRFGVEQSIYSISLSNLTEKSE